MIEKTDICVLGAGPAGMSAARLLATRGLKVVVLDERAGPGGNVHAAALQGPFADTDRLGRDYRKGAQIARAFAASEVDLRSGASLSRIDGDCLTYRQQGTLHRLRYRKLVLATGAQERPVPFPGWDLPGVMGAGAFQILLKQSGLVPARPYVLAGSGPLLLLMATQLLALGSRPVAVLQTCAVRSPVRAALRQPMGPAARPGAILKGLGYLATLRRAGVPVVTGVTRLAAVGRGEVAELRYYRGDGAEKVLDVGMVLVSEGVIPALQVPSALGCVLEWNAPQRAFRPATDAMGRSSRADTYVVGDAAGILGADAAPLSAALAALSIAAELSVQRPGDAAEEKRLRAALGRERRFRGFLDAAYPPGLAEEAPLQDATMVCRCEQVSAGQLRAAVADGARGPAQAKVFTRCGMGPCQGRICGSTANRVLSEAAGQTCADTGNFHIRFPLKPMSLVELATAPQEVSNDPDR